MQSKVFKKKLDEGKIIKGDWNGWVSLFMSQYYYFFFMSYFLYSCLFILVDWVGLFGLVLEVDNNQILIKIVFGNEVKECYCLQFFSFNGFLCCFGLGMRKYNLCFLIVFIGNSYLLLY